MELRFVTPDLYQLELLVTEVLALPVGTADRPPQGAAGLVDYRLAGKVSAAIQSGALTGKVGEKVLIAGRPKLPFDKILLFGSGDVGAFNLQIYAGLIDMLLSTLAQMGVRRAVVELPGRALGLIPPEAAAQILLEHAGDNPIFDTWTLVDTPAAQRAISTLLRQDRRRKWGV